MNLLPRLVLCLLILALGGCSRSTPAQGPQGPSGVAQPPRTRVLVQVLGSPGVRFEGSLGEPGATQAIAGRVPARFSIEVREVLSVRVQKADREGRLAIQVVLNGKEVASRSTTKAFGLVTLTHRLKR